MGTTYIASARALDVFLGKCEKCPRPVRYSEHTAKTDREVFPCIDCGTMVTCERLYGTVNRMECDPRCEGATGPCCSCACGGINHGGSWSQAGHMLASELEAYRAGIQRKQDEREVKASRERKNRADAFSAWKGEHAQLVTDLLASDWWEGRYLNQFLADMADTVRQGKPLTDRQAEASERTIQGRKDAAKRQADREATAVDVPAGRFTITGTIVAVYAVPDNFSYNGGDIRKIVVDTGTYRVRGTIPRTLFIEPGTGLMRAVYDDEFKGKRVQLTATLCPDGKEKGSGYFKRPTGAVYVT
jgi:hypothetical protein